MTPDNDEDLSAVAKRVRAYEANCAPVGYWEHDYDGDLFTLAREGYLVEHPADDDKPVTRGWLLSCGWTRVDLEWQNNDPDEAFIYDGYQSLGLRCLAGAVWAAYLLDADEFDGSESFLAPANT